MSSDVRAQARTSCERCHRRKKKCDRSLPQCKACQTSNNTCSFVELDDQEVGVYSISFVRGLEEQKQKLEEKLALATSQVEELEQRLASLSSATQHVGPNITTAPEMVPPDQVFMQTPPFTGSTLGSHLIDTWDYTAGTPTTLSFAVELKQLLLEATAERHLGSSSGLSFARLTQMVLRRLSPDKADFVFNLEPEADPQMANGAYLDVLGVASRVGQSECSISQFPTLFGSFPLSNLTESENVLDQLSLPSEPDMTRLLNFYFAHSHTLYPVVNRVELLAVVKRIHTDPQHSLESSPLWLFRIWMVLAVGSTAYASVTLHEESESILYFSKAMTYFESALEFGDMAALEIMMLQVSYSFFNQLGPNTWILVGLAARMATGIGLHTITSYENLTSETTERRKRLFFSVYMMDRVVSMALGRPFAIHDDDIDITPFIENDDESFEDGGRPMPQDLLQPSLLAVPVHILSLRRLASQIIKKVYSKRQDGATQCMEERLQTLQSLHKELIQWRRSMPFPLPNAHPRVPHLSSTWYDFNFYTHLAILYRPSPLLPVLDESRIKTLATASAMSIREAVNLHRQKRFAYNWLNLLTLYTSTLSLIYAITTQPDNLRSVLRETKAINDLQAAVMLFEILSAKFTAAKKITRMVEDVILKYQAVQ